VDALGLTSLVYNQNAHTHVTPSVAEFERWTKDPQTQKAVDMLVQLTKEVEGPVNIDMQPVIGRGIFMSGTPGVGKSTLFDSFAA
jgi:predicted ATPase